MNKDLLWLCYLLVEQDVPCATLKKLYDTLGDPNVEILTFAQALVDNDMCEDPTIIEDIVNNAWLKAQEGETPPFDSFEALEKAEREARGDSTTSASPPSNPTEESDTLPPIITEGIPLDANGMIDFAALENTPDELFPEIMATLLAHARNWQASDVHISADSRPFIRQNRIMKYISDVVINANVSERLNKALLTGSQRKTFEETNDYDYAMALDESNRFRVNLMVHKDGVAGTYRVIPTSIRPLEELGFRNADVIKKLLSYHNGLILVTGPVGSGKTTTLASLIDELNRNRSDHIITVEEPIEIIQYANKCAMTQRSVGPHTKTFHSALKGALRQDPDIIVIGELRDLETIEMAISAAETGHLVIGTLHTSDAASTLNRLLDVFPPAQQAQIRAMTAESLKGVICQRLLPSTDGGIVLACELLINNIAVGNLIREGKQHALGNVLETGVKEGMCSMDSYVLSLFKEGKISKEVAFENIHNNMIQKQVESQA